jgi:hypothetical protein
VYCLSVRIGLATLDVIDVHDYAWLGVMDPSVVCCGLNKPVDCTERVENFKLYTNIIPGRLSCFRQDAS